LALLGLLAFAIARRCRWGRFRQVSAVLCAGSIAAILSATLFGRIPDDWHSPVRFRSCDMGGAFIPTDTEALLNWGLMLPFTLLFVLATHRPILACIAAAALSVAIELAQSFFLLGGCQLSDLSSNVIGGIVGALAGSWITAFRTRRLSSA
tara:strand:+ start:1415 stop:1867 length:453 start_codon:yes stop_codon:yes gene_type:complete